jgi:hypothetical protein
MKQKVYTGRAGAESSETPCNTMQYESQEMPGSASAVAAGPKTTANPIIPHPLVKKWLRHVKKRF